MVKNAQSRPLLRSLEKIAQRKSTGQPESSTDLICGFPLIWIPLDDTGETVGSVALPRPHHEHPTFDANTLPQTPADEWVGNMNGVLPCFGMMVPPTGIRAEFHSCDDGNLCLSSEIRPADGVPGINSTRGVIRVPGPTGFHWGDVPSGRIDYRWDGCNEDPSGSKGHRLSWPTPTAAVLGAGIFTAEISIAAPRSGTINSFTKTQTV
ncbi:hypothetical protein B0H17DRAFT_1263468 [Mycena rosella]|uniref:Uncharacterized protein n=1 Tax=Mycena rosella TaxID=1033263 RepID=A0AAD7CPR7_MYCRO|nr:hypothetical protein B0H17DRAFT_1263468 [Mycena rosella]